MNLLVHGVGCNNKGAELMLRAIAEHVRSRGTAVRLVSSGWGSHEDCVRYGLWRLFDSARLRNRLFHALFRKRLFRGYGIVASHEIDAVLDASGFAFGDQWSPQSVAANCRFLLQFARAGKKLILLPQAFGPFSRDEIHGPCRQLLQAAALIYARDGASYAHVLALLGSDATLRSAPDFTNLLDGCVPLSFLRESHAKRVCFLPNQKMVEQHDAETGRAYIRFLAYAWNAVTARGGAPFVLLHQRNDEDLLPLMKAEVKQDVPVVCESDPVAIKGIIGASWLVIGSRFHGLVNALSQGVPCLGTSWSHKYQALFADYGFDDFLLTNLDRFDEIDAKLDRLTEQPSREALVRQLSAASETQKARARQMWDEVDRVLALNEHSPA